MRAGPLALVLVLLAALVGGVAWLAMHGDAPAPVVVDAREAPVEIVVAAAEALERSPAEVTGRSVAPSAAPAVAPHVDTTASDAPAVGALTGRVVLEPDLAPVAGAEVRIRAAQESLSTPTDEHGRFRFDLADGTVVSSVQAVATPTTTGLFRWERSYVSAGVERDVGDLVVNAGASLSGRVVDEDGAPVPSATVLGWCDDQRTRRAPDRTVRVGADGAFTLLHLGPRFHVVAEADGLACASGLVGEIAAGTHAEGLEVVLDRAALFSGRVLDADGEPAGGAAVSSAGGSSGQPTSWPGVSRYTPEPQQVEADAGGSFAFDVRRASPFAVVVHHDRHLVGRAKLEPDVPAVIRLDRGQTLRGLVLAADGTPVGGASVDARGHLLDDRGRATTDATGRFSLSALTATTTRGTVWVHADGHAIAVRQDVRIGPDAPDLVIELEPARVLAGVVLDGEDRPVAGARVTIVGDRLLEFDDVGYGEPTTWEWRCDRNAAWTDASGRFRFDDLYDGAFALTARITDLGEESVRGRARSGDEEIVLRFGELGRDDIVLEGRVVDALSGAPVQRFRFTPMLVQPDGSAGGRGHDVVDEDGRFRIGGYAAGELSVLVNAPGYARWDTPPRDLAPGVHRFGVALSPARTIDVIALDRDGAPVPDGTLSFRTRDGKPLQVDTGHGSTMTHTRLQKGEARAAGLPAERLVAVLRLPDDDRAHEVELDLLVEPTGPVELRVDASPGERRAFRAFLVVAPEGTETEDVLAALHASRMAPAGDIRWIDAEVRLAFRSERGATLYEASVAPCAESFCVEEKARFSSSKTTLPYPLVGVSVPAEVRSVTITSQRYAEQVVPIEAGPAGEPSIVILRPR